MVRKESFSYFTFYHLTLIGPRAKGNIKIQLRSMPVPMAQGVKGLHTGTAIQKVTALLFVYNLLADKIFN